jgi:hypothetical protein
MNRLVLLAQEALAEETGTPPPGEEETTPPEDEETEAPGG